MTVKDMLQEAVTAFSREGLPGPRLDAEVLLAHCLQKERLFLFTHQADPLTAGQIRQYRELAARRVSKEPVAYIIGYKEFWSLTLEVDRRVLIPRPDTEILVEEALKIAAASDNVTGRILDVGTGSGAIAIALASELKNTQIFASDISPGAIDVARRNAGRHALADRISFAVGDMTEPFGGVFDMIVSNPPYITEADFDALPVGVKAFEPHSALLGGPEGLCFHERLIRASEMRLKTGGWLIMEMGAGQREQVAGLFNKSGRYDEIRFRADYAGLDRVAIARRH